MHVASIWPYTMHPKNLRSFLADGISSLIPQAQRLIELRQVIAGLLPTNLRRSSSIANYKQGKIVIFAENSAVAAKLKLLAPGLLKFIRNQYLHAITPCIRRRATS